MPDVPIPADAEQLMVAWALACDPITAIFGDRIYTEVPGRDPEWPLLRFQRVGGAPVDPRGLLTNPRIQIDVWGGPKATAYAGIATVLGHAGFNLVGAHDLGFVSAVAVGGPSWLPDEAFEPPRPRYSADVQLWLRSAA